MNSIEILSKLVGFKTDDDEKGINKCLSFIEKKLKQSGWETIILKNEENNKNNLIAVFNGNLNNINEGLLLAGHIDTVTANIENWDSNPLMVKENDGKLFGLGIADMKSFTGSILNSLENIKKLNLKRPIIFALSNDEETVMYGINKIVKYFKENNIKPNYAIIGEPSNMMFSNSNKGFYEFETIINGKASHSSKPQNGVNAIYIMGKLVSYIEELALKYLSKGTTINVGIINGGRMCNIVPDKCSIRWDIRTFSRQALIEINNKINDFLDKLCKEYPSSSYSNEIVFKIPVFEDRNVKITNKLMKKYNLEEKPYDAATEAGFYQELGIDSIIFGCGDIKDAHSANEKIVIEDYIRYCDLLLSFIKDICC